VPRIQAQIAGTLDVLEAECAAHANPFWHGASPGHADIALACTTGFMFQAHPHLLRHPAVVAHGARCEALPVFQAVRQAFRPPA
jgi:glutathione S-transferase